MKQQSFDDIVRRKVEYYEAPVPADAWENIMGRKKKKRQYFFFWWISGLLLAGVLLVTTYIHQGKYITANNNNNMDTVNNADGSLHLARKIKDDSSANSLLTVVSPDISAAENSLSQHEQLITTTAKDLHLRSVTSSATGNDSSVFSTSTTVLIKANNEIMNNAGTNLQANTGTQLSDLTAITSQANIEALESSVKDSILYFPVKDTIAIIQYKKFKQSAWTIDISITPFIPVQKNADLLYLKRTEISSGHRTEYIADDVQTSVEPSLAYTFAARRKITNTLEIGAGIQYARIREKVRLSGTETNTTYSIVKRLTHDAAGAHLIDDTYKTVSTGMRVINASNSYNFFSIPVFVQYTFMEQHPFSLHLNTGAYINVIRKYDNSIKGSFEATYPGIQQSSQITNMSVDLFAGLRLSMASGKRFRFFAEPVFRYGFGRNNTSDMINAKYIHQAGLSLGGSYNIN